MSAVAPNRAVLLTLIATGLCLAMASAVPVANARRLQQVNVAGGRLRNRNPQQELTATLSLLTQLQGLLQALLKNVEDKLQNAATSVATVAQVQGLLQTVSARLQDLPNQEQAQLQTLHDPLLNQVLGGLPASVMFQLQSLTFALQAVLNDLQQPKGGVQEAAAASLQAAAAGLQGLSNQAQTQLRVMRGLLKLLNRMLSRLRSAANVQGQLQSLTVALNDLRGQRQIGVPQDLPSQGSAGAEQKP